MRARVRMGVVEGKRQTEDNRKVMVESENEGDQARIRAGASQVQYPSSAGAAAACGKVTLTSWPSVLPCSTTYANPPPTAHPEGEVRLATMVLVPGFGFGFGIGLGIDSGSGSGSGSR